MTSRYVTDTHALIWHLQKNSALSSRVRSLFSQADEGQIIIVIPTIVLVEMVYLAEKERISIDLVESLLQLLQSGSQNYQLASLDLTTIESLPQVPRNLISDLPDRIIAATALALNLPLLSRDSAIAQVTKLHVIW